MPEELNNQIFRKLKHIASMSRLSPDEMLAYQMSVMNDVALLDSIRTGREEGREEGRMEEKRSIARNLKSMGLSCHQISQASGLTLEEIEQL